MVIRWEPAGRPTDVEPAADCVGEVAGLVDDDPLVAGVLVTVARAEELVDVPVVDGVDEVEPGRLDVGSADPDVLCCVSDFEA
jgi:hypothetical protein